MLHSFFSFWIMNWTYWYKYLCSSRKVFIKWRSVELQCYVPNEGPEKTQWADVVIAAHAICVRTTMLSLLIYESFSGFHSQDKHNASFYFKCLWMEFFIRLQMYTIFLIGKSYSVQYLENKMATLNREPPYIIIFRQNNYSSNIISIIWQAALATDVPGPKIATTPAWYKKS